MAEMIIFCLFCGICNRARGSKLFGLTSSTEISRILSMLGIAIGTAILTFNKNWSHFDVVLFWAFICLMLWCTPAWDSLWGQTITGSASNRLRGLAKLALRMSLAAPCMIGLAYLTGHIEHVAYSVATSLLAVPYYIFGYLLPQYNGRYAVPAAELTAGAILGAIICVISFQIP